MHRSAKNIEGFVEAYRDPLFPVISTDAHVENEGWVIERTSCRNEAQVMRNCRMIY